MNILGISAFYHDSAAAIISDGKIIAAAQEERFTRVKHDSSFPTNAIKFCLEYSGATLETLDAVVFYDKPLLKFERLLETYYAYAPAGLISFSKAMPVWLKEKIFLKKLIREELNKLDESASLKNIRFLFPEHHLTHAASAFFPSSFADAAILTIDGVGEWATASVCHGKGNTITNLKEMHFPDSIGLLYSAFTYYLGFKVNSGEYKLMGLAPYGNHNSEQVKKYEDLILKYIVSVNDDGSVKLNQDYFNYTVGLTMAKDGKWQELFGIPKRVPEAELTQQHCDLALAIQNVTEDVVLKMATEAKRLTNSNNLCLAGGVALNCVANGKLLEKKIFEKIFIQPAAGDAGGSLGAALAGWYIYFNKERHVNTNADEMQGSYLGPEYCDLDIRTMAKKHKAHFEHCKAFDEVADKTASFLRDGNVVGWFQDRMEWGPRSLGNRSIIADARNPDMQLKLNLKIKYRESFRPFAPSVISEDVSEYFDLGDDSPYMLLVAPVSKKRRTPLPPNFQNLPLKEKLYYKRSDIPSVTHLDFSARVQTVHRSTNEKYWKLINAFKQKTGYGVIVNTSFNVRGEPIVCTPEDAYKCLMRTEMDYLVINNFIFDKKLQPVWKEKSDWKEEYALD